MLVERIFEFLNKHKEGRVLAVFTRAEPEPHCEIHYVDRVEFWTLDGKKLGVSKVHQVK